MARAHSHAAPPSSISTPVDNEKLLELTRMADRRMAWKLCREVLDHDSYRAQRLSATLAIGLCPCRNGVARRTHRLRSVARHLEPERLQFEDPKHCDHRNQGNEHAETNRTGIHAIQPSYFMVETTPALFRGETKNKTSQAAVKPVNRPLELQLCRVPSREWSDKSRDARAESNDLL